MFKLFKKSAENKVEVAEPKKSKYPKEVLEIHHEFETAADKLLQSAKEVIKEAGTKDAVKVSRLESLGFKQASQVTELKPILQKAQLSKGQIELLSYYQRNYPLNKFITEEQVKIICHKYNLVCGDVSRFKGFVPEKNLREIEGFKLKDSEQGLVELVNTCVTDVSLGFYNESDLSDRLYLSSPQDENEELVVKAMALGVRRDHVYIQRSDKKNTLKICAPVKDMDISGLELVEGYKLQKKHIPDPVVLQPVKGGYLILTAWGDEASDELVVNQKMN